MRYDFSPGVERSLEVAERLAREAGLAEPTSLLLLRGLIDDEESQASSLLTKHGLPRESLADRLKQVQSSASPSGNDVLTLAYELSRRHGSDSTITGDCFLLSLLRCDAELRKQLEAWGFHFSAFEAEIVGEVGSMLSLPSSFKLEDPVERLSAARILDVNANRVRESLRILDDYARFVLNDPFLTREVKTLRHDFNGVMNHLSSRLLLESRETLHDVGTLIGTESEYRRESPSQIARVNLKRLQESLRSIEEYGKILDEDFAGQIEQLRYRTYTLERGMLTGADSRERLEKAQLYLLVSAGQCEGSLEWTIEEAVAGGVDLVQLREKSISDRELLDRAKRVRKVTRDLGVLFIMNDRPDLARLSDADGVHLGQDDLSLYEARKILGPERLIGVSTHDLNQVRKAVSEGANYLGVGPTFPSSTKSFETFPGVEFVRQSREETNLPTFVIGGVHAGTIDEVIQAGARRVAVSAAITGAKEPRLAARILKQALEG